MYSDVVVIEEYKQELLKNPTINSCLNNIDIYAGAQL